MLNQQATQKDLHTQNNHPAYCWLGKVLSALPLLLVLVAPIPTRAETNTCTTSFGNLPEQPIVGKEYFITIQFTGCAAGSFGSVRLRNVENNSTTVLASTLILNGSDKLELQGQIPSSGKYVFESINKNNNTLLPYIVDKSPIFEVLPATTTNLVNNSATPTNINTPALNQPNNLQSLAGQTNTSILGNSSTTAPAFISGIVANPINYNSLGELIVGLIRFLLAMVGALSVLFIIIGAVRMVSSAGNEKTVTAGKQTVTWAIIGLAVALLAFSFINLIQSVLGRK